MNTGNYKGCKLCDRCEFKIADFICIMDKIDETPENLAKEGCLCIQEEYYNEHNKQLLDGYNK